MTTSRGMMASLGTALWYYVENSIDGMTVKLMVGSNLLSPPNGPEGYEFEWYWGDGGEGELKPTYAEIPFFLEHEYETPGKYTISFKCKTENNPVREYVNFLYIDVEVPQ